MNRKTLVFGIGFIITILVSHNLPGASTDGLPVSRPPSRVLTLPEKCALEHPTDPDREWDEEREIYLPINWDWRECMGVGRK